MQLTSSQVAEILHVSESTVALWVRQDNLPAHEVNSQYRFDRAELLAWAATHDKAFSPDIFQAFNVGDVSEISLADSLDRGGVLMHVRGNDRYEVFREAIEGLPVPESFAHETLLDLLMAHEKSGGTAIGHGIAIPHTRYPVVVPGGDSLVRVCYLEHRLEYYAADGKPVDTLFLMICPSVQTHLQLLARLACVLASADVRNLLAARPDQSRLVSAVRVAEALFSADRETQQA